MSYTPTTWVEKVTKVGPTNLNKLENGLQAAAAVADAALPAPAGTNGQFLKKVGGVWVPTSFAASDIPNYPTDSTKALLGDGTWAQIANAQVAAAAAIAYSKLSLSGAVVNADIAAAAAVSRTKLARDYTEVTKSAVQSIANVTLTAVTFDTETVDDSNMHDNVTNNTRITFATGGLWLVGSFTTWTANGTGGRLSQIKLNGATIIAASDAPAANGALSQGDDTLIVPHVFAANDYIELIAYQNSGGALNLVAATKLWAVRL